jgi:WD40 repeat protein
MNRFFHSALIALGITSMLANAQVINEDRKFGSSDAAVEDQLGQSIAMSNGIVAVGSRFNDDFGSDSGSAYLFDAATGSQLIKLLPNDPIPNHQFGQSIAIDNGLVAVGAWLDSDSALFSGAAYVFDASTGVQISKLLATDGVFNHQFGVSIAIDNGIVAVGARLDDENGNDSGAAYLFDALTGVQLFKLLPTDGAGADQFGWSIDIHNGLVAVGAPNNDDAGSNSGSAYLFDATTGLQTQKLLPTDGTGSDQFGVSISISNGTVAVGAHLAQASGTGSAYLFNATTGAQTFKLTASDAQNDDRFGRIISIDNGIVAVGAHAEDQNGSNSGAAYLFDANTGNQMTKLLTSDGVTGDLFGYSIAIDNGIVAAAAILDDDGGSNSGSVYIFDIACPADLTGDGVLNFFDISAFLSLFAANDLSVDFSGDGILNFFDISIFVIEIGRDCPLNN